MRDEDLANFYAELEIQDFKLKHPEHYIFFIDLERHIATTRQGRILGRVIFECDTKTVHGGLMHQLLVVGINGLRYRGTFVPGAVSYASGSMTASLIDDQPIRGNVLPFRKSSERLQCLNLR